MISDFGGFANSSVEAHRKAAIALVSRFCAQDFRQYKTKATENSWGQEFASGCIKSGDFVHVFLNPKPCSSLNLAALERGSRNRSESRH